MKVSLLHYSAPPVVGGVESVISHHARLLAAAGHQVQILAGRGSQTQEQVPFVPIPLLDSRHPDILEVKSMLDAGKVPPQFSTLAGEIRARLGEILPTGGVLIAHNVCSLHKNLPLTAALYELSQAPGAPKLILWHHDLAWTTPRYREELHEGRPWDLLKQDWPWAAQVVVSEQRQQELSRLISVPPERIHVIPNGIDIPRFLKLEAQTAGFVNRLDLLSADPLLLLPVRITPRKNIELALRSLACLSEAFPAAALVVTGPLGPHNPANVQYFSRLSALRAELGLDGRAHFLAELTQDYLPDDVIADFYRLSDALLFPSREEGFGIPILEAGLAGLPIFCADIPPLRALGGRFASYFSPNASPEEVAALIASRLSDDPVYALRQRVKSHYSWERIYADRIAPLITEKS